MSVLNQGYVYILINESYINLIKIGSTSFKSEDRAKRLSATTGVPTPFKVAFEMFVDNCKEFEKEIHKRLADYRVNPNREFFRFPLHKTIELMYKLKEEKEVLYTIDNQYEAIDITKELKQKYLNGIEATINSLKLFQTNERVYFEITKDNYIGDYLKDQIIKRTDLGFICDCDPDDLTFNVKSSITKNVQLFLKLDSHTMVNCFDEIFTEEKRNELWELYQKEIVKPRYK